ncbi:DUF427 domain-containing protein [Humidisolicoccus flavus]|uniref:DUF427 domain-containing protein n=1 Tax=Humidisolicoccus flavus TaxID=3111414 RepID=UPI0032544F20
MKAVVNGVVLAEAPEADLARIEGNWYFPPASLNEELFSKSPTPYHCSWKGDAQYWDITVEGKTISDAAWSYPEPIDGAHERVGKDFSGFVAFDRAITVEA